MPEDQPEPPSVDKGGIPDSTPGNRDSISPDPKPKSRLPDFGTLDANVFDLAGEGPPVDSEESIPSTSPADFGTLDADVFKVEGEDPDGGLEATSPPPPRVSPRKRDSGRGAEARPEPRVDEIWSRGKEWGPTLMVLGAVGLATLLLVYLAFAASQFGLGLAVMLLGAIAFIILSYPIVITLERPVRMTPEQAIRDYYAALSHHLPHFRRMWLLLSSNGHSSSQFGSFEGFVACWKTWLLGLKGTEAGFGTPLHFDVENVKAEKSAGQSAVKVSYSLLVFVRGHRDEPPLAVFSLRQWTVRGPDGMWYLDDGAPPVERINTAEKNQGVGN